MFSQSLKQKIAKFVLVLYTFANLLPAFCITNAPDYVVNIERCPREYIDNCGQMADIINGVKVSVQRLVHGVDVTQESDAPEGIYAQAGFTYETILDQIAIPFVPISGTSTSSEATLCEIVQTVQAEIVSQASDESDDAAQTVQAEIVSQASGESDESDDANEEKEALQLGRITTDSSHGFCLSLVGIGDILISAEGDIIFDVNDGLDNSLKIFSPGTVFLKGHQNENSDTSASLEIEAAAMLIYGEEKAVLDNLKFTKHDYGELGVAFSISSGSELVVRNLQLANTSLENAGTLTIKEGMNLNYGNLINTGTIITTADKGVLENITSMQNSGNINSSGKVLLESAIISNTGLIKANNIEIVSSELLENHGTIETSSSLEINGLGDVVNENTINGNSGKISFTGEKFIHKSGEISGANINFESKKTALSAPVSGQTVLLSGNVENSGYLNFQKGVIDGTFVNLSQNALFNNVLELTGKRSEVHNGGIITTDSIVSNADAGILADADIEFPLKKITAKSVRVNKHLQIEASLHDLKNVITAVGAELFVKELSDVSSLDEIANDGKTVVMAKVPNLSHIKNTGHLQIKTESILPKITDLDSLRGTLDLDAICPNIEELNVQKDTTINVFGKSNFANLTNITVNRGGNFLADDNVKFNRLQNIKNFGTTTLEATITGLREVYNAAEASLHFLGKTRISNQINNEGNMLIRHKSTGGYKDFDLRLSGTYVGAEGSLLRLEGGVDVSLCDCDNRGTLSSKNRLSIVQAKDVTKLGNIIAGDTINYHVINKLLNLNESFIHPVINNPKKTLKIQADVKMNITSKVDWNVDMDVKTPFFDNNSELTVKSFKADTDMFYNTGALSALESIDIKTIDFTNTNGKLKAGSDINLSASGKFLNDGGGNVQKNVQELLPYYAASGRSYVYQTKTIFKDVYNFEPSKAGVIASGGEMNISAREIDNGFGILNAAKKLDVESQSIVKNESGFMYSGGTASIKGNALDNGYKKDPEYVYGVNPNAPRRERVIKDTWTYNFRYNRNSYINGSVTRTFPSYFSWDIADFHRDHTQDFCELFDLRSVNCRIVVPSVDPHPIGGTVGWAKHGGRRLQGTQASRYEEIITSYYPQTYNSNASQYPGYIFSDGDMKIDMISEYASTYLGTIVSGGDIAIKIAMHDVINGQDRGTIVARGDVALAVRNARLEQFAMQVRNVSISFVDDLIIQGIIHPILTMNRSVLHLVDLNRMALEFGFLINNSVFKNQGLLMTNRTDQMLLGNPYDDRFFVEQASRAFFIGKRPTTEFFMSSVQHKVLVQLVMMVLAPMFGRNVLLNADSIVQGLSSGANISDIISALKNPDSMKKPLIVWGERVENQKNEDQPLMLENLVLANNGEGVEVVLDNNGEGAEVALDNNAEVAEIELNNNNNMPAAITSCTPYLLCNIKSQIDNLVEASNKISLRTSGNAQYFSGVNNLKSENLTIAAEKELEVKSEFIFDEDLARIGMTPAVIDIAKNLTLSGDEGVRTEGVNISAGSLLIESKNGNIVDVPIDLGAKYDNPDRHTLVRQTRAIPSSFTTRGDAVFQAPNGSIEQCGTKVFSQGDITYDANNHVLTPLVDKTEIYRTEGRTTACMRLTTAQSPEILAPQGTVNFDSKNTTLVAAQVNANKLTNVNDGNFKALSFMESQEIASRTIKKGGLFGLGRTRQETYQRIEVAKPTKLTITDSGFWLGSGEALFEGALVNAPNVVITKDLKEIVAYEKNVKITKTHSSGFFAPRLKGDPILEAVRSIQKIVSLQDVVPTAISSVGAVTQTLSHIATIANINALSQGTVGGPIGLAAQIGLSRWVRGPMYSNMTQRTETNESKPVQSDMDIGVLFVSNDKTHLEGKWRIKDAQIYTKELVTEATKHEVHQRVETHGFSIALSSAAVFGACLNPTALTMTGYLPTVAYQDSDSSAHSVQNIPMTLTAERLFIRSENAIFSGSTIRAKMIDMIVTGDLKVKTLIDTFKSTKHSTSIVGNFAAISGILNGSDVDKEFRDPRFGAIPTVSLTSEKKIIDKINTVAQLVGEEQFYVNVIGVLHEIGADVGLKQDGHVINPADAGLEQDGHVVNPADAGLEQDGHVVNHADVGLEQDGHVVNPADAGGVKCDIKAGHIIHERLQEVNRHTSSVLNPCVGELFACMSQIDEFKAIKSRFLTEMLKDGSSMKEATVESEEITPEVVRKAKHLKIAKRVNREEVLSKIESDLSQLESELPQIKEDLSKSLGNSELRSVLLKNYLDGHAKELVADVEKCVLDEIRSDVDFAKNLKSEKAAEFLQNYVKEESPEEFDMYLDRYNDAAMVSGYGLIGKAFGSNFIPGYSTLEDGGTVKEFVASAAADVALIIAGGKVAKVVFKGTTALYQGAKALGRKFMPGHVHVIERCTARESELFVGKALGLKARPQVSYLEGNEVKYGKTGSVRPDFVTGDTAFEVKNYDVVNNSDALIRTIAKQVKERAIHLPQGMKQSVQIDIRGQKITSPRQRSIIGSIVEKSEGILSSENVRFIKDV